jgi:hypothetical protein
MALVSRPAGDRRFGAEIRCARGTARMAILSLSLMALLLAVPAVVRGAGDNPTSPPGAKAGSPAVSPGSAGSSTTQMLDANLGAWNKSILMVLGSLACAFFVAFFITISRGDVPRLESDLGGFGGGLGGWQLSPSLAFLLGAIALSVCVTMLAVHWMSPPTPTQATSPNDKPAAASPAGSPGSGGAATGAGGITSHPPPATGAPAGAGTAPAATRPAAAPVGGPAPGH